MSIIKMIMNKRQKNLIFRNQLREEKYFVNYLYDFVRENYGFSGKEDIYKEMEDIILSILYNKITVEDVYRIGEAPEEGEEVHPTEQDREEKKEGKEMNTDNEPVDADQEEARKERLYNCIVCDQSTNELYCSACEEKVDTLNQKIEQEASLQNEYYELYDLLLKEINLYITRNLENEDITYSDRWRRFKEKPIQKTVNTFIPFIDTRRKLKGIKNEALYFKDEVVELITLGKHTPQEIIFLNDFVIPEVKLVRQNKHNIESVNFKSFSLVEKIAIGTIGVAAIGLTIFASIYRFF